ncbi:MAG: ankyrin repeat domain-containing protein [Rickettsiaceae bacterium]
MKHKTLLSQFTPSIFSAVQKNDLLLIMDCILNGENVNQHRSEDGFTPIFIAVSHNNVSTLKFLLAHGADLTEKSNAGMTALDLALSSTDFEPLLVKHLLLASGICLIQEKFNIMN